MKFFYSLTSPRPYPLAYALADLPVDNDLGVIFDEMGNEECTARIEHELGPTRDTVGSDDQVVLRRHIVDNLAIGI